MRSVSSDSDTCDLCLTPPVRGHWVLGGGGVVFWTPGQGELCPGDGWCLRPSTMGVRSLYRHDGVFVRERQRERHRHAPEGERDTLSVKDGEGYSEKP
jgi:hypothetical protein